MRRVIHPLAGMALGAVGLLAALSGPAFASSTPGVSTADQSGTASIPAFGVPITGMLPGMVEERGFEVVNSAATASGPVTAIVTPSSSPLFAKGGVTITVAACSKPWVVAASGATCPGSETASQSGTSTASIDIPVASVPAAATVYVDAMFALPASATNSFESLSGSLSAQVEVTAAGGSLGSQSGQAPAPPRSTLPPMQIHSGAPTSSTSTNVVAVLGGVAALLAGVVLLAANSKRRRSSPASHGSSGLLA